MRLILVFNYMALNSSRLIFSNSYFENRQPCFLKLTLFIVLLETITCCLLIFYNTLTTLFETNLLDLRNRFADDRFNVIV